MFSKTSEIVQIIKKETISPKSNSKLDEMLMDTKTEFKKLKFIDIISTEHSVQKDCQLYLFSIKYDSKDNDILKYVKLSSLLYIANYVATYSKHSLCPIFSSVSIETNTINVRFNSNRDSIDKAVPVFKKELSDAIKAYEQNLEAKNYIVELDKLMHLVDSSEETKKINNFFNKYFANLSTRREINKTNKDTHNWLKMGGYV